ncbi:hypothetical protein [Ktedonobacter racemifer]|uniref:Uncharacterized protein n=1 Tax=Ktedonobacter racemifer DSM 44963 TaxID=485913 RepID=D6U2W4_KTERA|nr:hypothetical protein [Ktedonobacter racemifer]EFH82869.1 hypothetical protein Krac_3740 [Ktedonobacter racemifer DSM 44963]
MQCIGCSQAMCVAYHTQQTVTTLKGMYRLTLHVRRCHKQHSHGPIEELLQKQLPSLDGCKFTREETSHVEQNLGRMFGQKCQTRILPNIQPDFWSLFNWG